MGLRGPQTKESVFKIGKPRKPKKPPKVIDCSDMNLGAPQDDSLMADLMWVYQQLGGRKALLTLLRGDSKAKKDFLKTLLIHETKKLEKANHGGGTGKGKLLILKGLYDGEDTLNDAQKSLQNILDPHSQKEDAAAEGEEFIYELDEVVVDELIEGGEVDG